jgi:predicted dithiol-disulfide oxidoreductase (DUF899 family)
MFGPQRERPCPMCTSLLSAWDGEARDVDQRVALAVVARSPIERLMAFKNARGWRSLKLYCDVDGAFSRDYHGIGKDGGDDAAFNVFTRQDGTIRHFWSGEMGMETADPGEDPRGAPDLMPLWTILDATPEGRGTNWYPLVSTGIQSSTIRRKAARSAHVSRKLFRLRQTARTKAREACPCQRCGRHSDHAGSHGWWISARS